MKGTAVARAGLLLLTAGALACCAPSTSVVWQGRSPDHRVPVQVWASGEAQWVTIGAHAQPGFPGISTLGVVFSPDSRQFAYPALTDSGWVVIRARVDEPERLLAGEAWDGIGAILFDASSAGLAYAAVRDSSWVVVENGHAGSCFEEILHDSLVYSRRGSTLVYVARSPAGVQVVVDGDGGPAFDGVGEVALSADGGRVAYAVREGKWARLVVDGTPGRRWLAIRSVVVSGDGEHVAHAARDDRGWHVVVDGVRQGPWSTVRGLHFGTGGELVFVAADETGEFLVRGGQREPGHPSIGRVVRAGSGGSLGYVAHAESGDLLVVDGAIVARRPVISELAFSGDGRVVGFVAEGVGGPSVVVHGTEWPLDVVVGGSLVLDEDGSNWACLGGSEGEEKIRLVVNGRLTDRTLEWGEFMDSLMRSPLKALEEGEREAHYRTWVRAEMQLVQDD